VAGRTGCITGVVAAALNVTVPTTTPREEAAMKCLILVSLGRRAGPPGRVAALLSAVASLFLAAGGLRAGWERIGGPKGIVLSRVLGGTQELYATEGPGLDPTGDICVYLGKGAWQNVGGPGSAFAVGPSTAQHPWLVGLSVDKKRVYMMTYATVSQHKHGAPDPVTTTASQWTQIGGPAELGGDIEALYGGGAGVFAKRSGGPLLRYDGQLSSIDPVRWTNQRKWTDLGVDALDGFVVNDMNVFARNDFCVYRYIGGPWSYMGGPWKIIYGLDDRGSDYRPFGAPQKLYAGGRKLFMVGSAKRDIYRWDSVLSQWTRVGGPGKMFAVTADGDVYGLSPDSKGLYHYVEGRNRWEDVGGPGKSGKDNPKGTVANRIIGGGVCLYAEAPNGDLWQYTGKP
jgi:hypothetical protein